MDTNSTNKNSQNQLINLLTKKVAKGGGITLAGSAFGKLTQFGFYILLGRVLGAGGYGLYALGYSIIQLASQFSILGLHNGIVRFIALYKGEGELRKVKGTLVSAFSIATVASLLVGTLLFLFSGVISTRFFNDPHLIPVLRIFAVALPFFVLMQMASHTARGFQKMIYFVGIYHLFWPMTNLLLVGVIFILSYRLLGTVYGFLVTMILSAAVGLFLITKRIFPQVLSLTPNYEIKRLLRFSLPVIFIGLAQLILNQTDRLMVGYFLTSEDVGVYSVASRIGMQTTLIINSFNMIFAPLIAHLYNQQQIRELDDLFKLVTRWIITLTLPFVLIMTIFSKQIMGLFGSEFTVGSSVLIALAIAYFVNAASGSVGFILIMTGKQDIELVNTLCMATINVGLNIWFIQIWGILGAAVATGLSIATMNIIRLIEVFKQVGVQPYNRKYFKPIVSSTVVALLIAFLLSQNHFHFHWIIGLVLCPLLFLGATLLMGIEEEDILVLQAAKQKLSSIIHSGIF